MIRQNIGTNFPNINILRGGICINTLMYLVIKHFYNKNKFINIKYFLNFQLKLLL